MHHAACGDDHLRAAEFHHREVVLRGAWHRVERRDRDLLHQYLQYRPSQYQPGHHHGRTLDDARHLFRLSFQQCHPRAGWQSGGGGEHGEPHHHGLQHGLVPGERLYHPPDPHWGGILRF